MSTALQLVHSEAPALNRPIRMLPVPWGDPQTVSPPEQKQYIQFLETRCQENPASADLKTCLGMAYAMNFDAYKSMDVLEAAVAVEPDHFFAQLKLSELHYRLRSLECAEEETIKALNLAGNGWELAMARKQLQDIRQKREAGTRRPAFDKPLRRPVFAFSALFVVISLAKVFFQ